MIPAMRVGFVALVVGVTTLGSLLVLAAPAVAHDPLGRAQPRVDTTVKEGDGLSRVIAFRVRDSDSGDAIPQATLAAVASDDSGRSVTGDVTRMDAELFRCAFSFPTPGHWRVDVQVGGTMVVPTSFSIYIDVQDKTGSPAPPSVAQPVVPAGSRCVTPSQPFVARFRKGVRAKYRAKVGIFQAVKSRGKFGPFPRSLQKGVYFLSSKVAGVGAATWAVSADAYRGGSGVMYSAEPVARKISTYGIDVSPAILNGRGISSKSDGFAQSRACTK